MAKTTSVSILCTIILLSLLTFPGVDIVPNASAEPPWENIQTISKTVEVPPGGEYYAYFDYHTNSIIEMSLPSIEAGLSQDAKDALGQVPEWMYEDMAKKFMELGDTTIDVGDFATPVFADMDADGDLDLSSGSLEGTLYYYENVGTKNRPIYVMDDEMYSYICGEWCTDKSKTALAIADLDADSDNDLIIGYDLGLLYYFENIGTTTQAIWGPNEMLMGPGGGDANSYPALTDLDDDGDFDMAVGGADGYINFYENVGTPDSADWQASYRMYTGEDDDRAITFADMDDDGDFDLSVGDGDLATLYYYRNVGSSSNEVWLEDLTYYNGVTPEYGTAPAIVDINGDFRPDLFVGGNSGRLYFYSNSGTASSADWLIWSSYQVTEGYNYYPKEVTVNYRADYHMDRYADLILSSASKYKDEIGFAIAHTPTENLKSLSQNQTQLFVDNAHLIYQIDTYLDYVEVIEKEDYTTTRYNFGEPGNIIQRELPRDIYYWYIVNPKITDENVYYIHPDDSDSNHPTDPADGGRFWREYLFFNVDDSYPADTSGDPNDGVDDYPEEDVSPPLLKDLLEDIDVLFNGTTWFAPGGNYSSFKTTGYDNIRPFNYGGDALIRVSNWVGKTLILNQQEVSDSERPIQPVRIAHHHNGNCGELQDLSTAAARTALIPAAGVLLLGEDHVWIEFYENGWHQWDNYWSDGGSVIDKFDNYWVGWGQRGGSGIWKQGGDDDTWEVTDHYIPEEDLNYVTVRVLDINGDPVDGARVLVISYWLKVNIEGYQIEIPFPCIWNYTNSNGETLFKLATQEGGGGNKNFTFKIISKVGSAESGKIELEHGQDYTFSFYLEGSAPNPQLNTDPQTNPNPPDPSYRLGVGYQVISASQHPQNLLTGNYHPLEIPPEEFPEPQISDYVGNHMDSFMTTEQEFDNFLKGYNFDSYEFEENLNSDSFDFDLPDNENWYFVLSNRDSIETTKVIELTLNLYYKTPPHSVKIVSPPDGSQHNLGDTITISGIVTNESELLSLRLSCDSGNQWTYPGYNDSQWDYKWNTGSLDLGLYTIQVEADFGSTQSSDSIEIELVDLEPPTVEIINPEEYAQINIGQIVNIYGTVYDNIEISQLQISTDGGDTWIDIISSLQNSQWFFDWTTQGMEPGGYIIQIQASDGSNLVLDSVYVELEDFDPPFIQITSPDEFEYINCGDVIIITGEASDNRQITSLQISTDGGQNWIDILSNLINETWTYEWNTQGLPIGSRDLVVNTSDGAFNNSHAITIELADLEEPYVSISTSFDDSQFDVGSQINILGEARDNIEILELELSLNGGRDYIDILSSLNDDQWSYDWDTTDYSLGFYTIIIEASDGSYDTSEHISIELIDEIPPTVTITSPSEDESFSCGDMITVTGTALDNMEITELSMSTNEGESWIDIHPSLIGDLWFYNWDTDGLPIGSYTITVAASDGNNPTVYTSVDMNLEDTVPPILEIASLEDNTFYVGDSVIIEGEASDNFGIASFFISTDDGETWSNHLKNLDSDGEWSYVWDTGGLETGIYIIHIKISDGSNEVEDTLTIFLVDEIGDGAGGVDDEVDFYLILLILILTVILIIAILVAAIILKRPKKIS